MKFLELPSGSILIAPDQTPDSVYILKRGFLGIFDKLERLMAFIYKEESFGLESIFEMKSFMHVKSLTQVEIDMYEPQEFLDSLNPSKKEALFKTLSNRIWYVKRRYPLKADERIRDIIKELKDNGISSGEISAIALNLSVSDALAFERIKGEYGI